MEKIKIGQIANVVGLRGELKVYPYCQHKERFEELKSIYIEAMPFNIENVRYKANLVILKLEGVDDRTQAETIKGKDLWMSEDELEKLPEGTYYVKDIIGFPVEDRTRGRLGVLIDVRSNGAQDLFVIKKTGGGEFLVPAVDQFFVGVDEKAQVVLVDLIEGMYED